MIVASTACIQCPALSHKDFIVRCCVLASLASGMIVSLLPSGLHLNNHASDKHKLSMHCCPSKKIARLFDLHRIIFSSSNQKPQLPFVYVQYRVLLLKNFKLGHNLKFSEHL